MKSTFFQALVLAGAAIAAPVIEAETPGAILRRNLNARGLTDVEILNFALTLEHLESTFYMQGLANYTQADFDAVKSPYGLSPRLRFNIEEISKDEATHVSFLTSAISAAGGTPVQQCTYDFGVTDVQGFIGLAEALEGVGVSAYLGAAASISNPAYLTAAGSILTVEARHNAYIRNNQDPPMTPFPAPFEIPLDPMQVYTLASAFIVSCPTGSYLPFTAFPSLTFGPKNASPSRSGDMIGLRTTKALPNEKLYCAWPYVTGAQYTDVYDVDMDGTRAKCTVPSEASGQTYVVLTTQSSGTLSDNTTVAGPAIVPVEAAYVYGGFPM